MRGVKIKEGKTREKKTGTRLYKGMKDGMKEGRYRGWLDDGEG